MLTQYNVANPLPLHGTHIDFFNDRRHCHVFFSFFLSFFFFSFFFIRCTKMFTDNSRVRAIKGANGRQKTYEIFHVYCVFYSGFMCQTTVIFGITKDGSLVLTTLAS